MIVCTRCSARNPDGRRFCVRCETFLEWDGEQVDEGQAPERVPPPPPEPDKRRRPVVAISIGIGLAVVLLAALAFFVLGGKSGPSITEVSFQGLSSNAVVVVRGKDLGVSAPAFEPLTSPDQAGSGCPPPSSGADTGHDFGPSALYLKDETRTWVGGYSPEPTSCVGLIVQAWGPTCVQFVFGSEYGDDRGIWAVHPGDSYAVEVRGASHTGAVTFTNSPGCQ